MEPARSFGIDERTLIRAENRGLAWIIGGFVFCPCHLPITLAVVASLLAGTAVGAVVSSHRVLVGSASTVVWIAVTWRGVRLLRRP